jgi:SAM-dependent methyltransferase
MTEKNHNHADAKPAALLREYGNLFAKEPPPGPVLDLACGNGIYLATVGVPVVLCDISEEVLSRARHLASELMVTPQFRVLDLEKEGPSPLGESIYGGMIVFRYLHRPLIPAIKASIRSKGVLIYETFTVEQIRYGKPTNPDYLLKPGELRQWFADWEILHYSEGIQPHPERAVAQLVCWKP